MLDIDLEHNSLGVATKKFTSIPDLMNWFLATAPQTPGRLRRGFTVSAIQIVVVLSIIINH